MIKRAEALRAGTEFMVWVFSDGAATPSAFRGFAQSLGLKWSDISRLRDQKNGTTEILKGVETAVGPASRGVFEWFEVGQNTMLVSNMAATGAPSGLLDEAISGYRDCLENAGVRITERNRLETLIRDFPSQDLSDKERTLRTIQEILREQATIQDSLEISMPKNNNPWISGSFYLFVAVVLGAALLVIAKSLSFVYFPVIVIGSIVGLSVVGALQLRNDGILDDKTFLELMVASFKYMPIIGSRYEKNK